MFTHRLVDKTTHVMVMCSLNVALNSGSECGETPVSTSSSCREIPWMIRPYPGLTKGRVSLIGWGGGGRAPSAQCRPRRVWGHAPPEFLFYKFD